MALGVNDHQALASSHRPLTDSLNKYSSADKLICIQSVCYKSVFATCPDYLNFLYRVDLSFKYVSPPPSTSPCLYAPEP